ncbi:TPA: pentapeptide repeat-containing protein [Campylobacter jejuni]|nr:pentapeptide repeat-containing protein [Campylobacter jejuni]HEG2902212.1 pentapeptide repeat-containing protein [Campylobacter jejuni]HEG3216241.1 pentapeptide repeat-containing protein [Campylobacter jejuni]HEG4705273.1 pentapeptide repeat-containing protein [Campylobacter jejuni]HEG5419023.1 pentapeptide repeat-containing protein [Campylobacter jejuni]
MKELTKEQRQIIENKIKQEVENFNTFLDRQYCIDKIYKTIINRIKSHYDIGFDFLTIIEKNITEIDKISYEVIAIEEIKQILNIEDNIRYISGVFYIFGLSRTNLKTQVHGVVDILSLFETYPLVFDHCIFTQRIGYFNQITNIKKISFLNCEFEEQIYLNFQECLDIFQMDNCVFEDRVTIKGKFNDNVYFNNSIFKDYANFHTCEFEKTANFYGVRFEKTPNFSQVIFKGNLNAINAKLNFTFDDLQQRIKQECTSYESQRTTKKAGVIPNLYQEKSLDKFANDFRDSFRTFKNALIKDNNLLDASNFHKYELYCKEIELKQNWDKKGENVKNTTDLEKNVSRIRDFVDFLLLGFYRKLCDHHTDFLKVFNNLILLISLYILFIFVGSFEFDLEKKSIQNLNKTSDMFSYLTKVKEVIINFSFMQQYYNHILISFVAVCFICLIVIFYKIFKNIKLDFIIIKNIIFKDIIKSILILCVYLLFLLIILIYINIYIPKNQNNLNILSNIGIFFTFCIFYLWMVCLNTLFLRYIFICISYIIVIISMGANITILNPFIEKLINDKIFSNDPLFIYLTFAYTILIFLVLFSLQKTARKNSIVPS